MRFGIWIEPEMVSQRSQLYADHADWAIGVPTRPHTEGRNQLVLDMSRHEVVDHLFGVLSDLLGRAPISYVKWDMNRNITEPYSPALPAEPAGRVLPPLHPGRVRALRAADEGIPGGPVRVLRRRRRPLRPGHAGLRAAGLDQRRHGRHRAPEDPVGHLAGLPAQLHGGPRLGGAEPPDRPDHAARDAGGGGLLRRLGLRARPDGALSNEEREEVTGQIAYYKERRELFQRGRFVRLREPLRGRRQRNGLDDRFA